MNPFETETMADLHLRQGHRAEALAIYRRLLERTADEAARERMRRRIAAIAHEGEGEGASEGEGQPLGADADSPIAADPTEPPLATPGVRVRCSGERLLIEWRLPPGTEGPAIEVLLVKAGAGGVATETRILDVDGNDGQVMFGVEDLHSARVAAGRRRGGIFVPLARTKG